MKKASKEQLLVIINDCLHDNTDVDGEQKEVIEITNQMLDDDLSEKGMDSIAFIKIVVTIEEVFECEIPDEKLLLTEMNTVNKMLGILHSLEDSGESESV